MLSKEQNEQLTQVGPGKPMGELLRRYWYPIAFERDLADWPIKKVRLLGEDFALWKTPQGGYGIMQERWDRGWLRCGHGREAYRA